MSAQEVRPDFSSRATEWPTLLLYLFNLGLFTTLVVLSSSLPWWVLLVLGGMTVCLHGSLQHEFLHGHPTRWQTLNHALALVPLSLWMPYALYRDSHLAHHRAAAFTCPDTDPESFYVTAARWQRMGPLARALERANTSLTGRMLIGPWLAAGRFLLGEARLLLAGDRYRRRIWGVHLACTVALLLGIHAAGLPAWQYVLLFAYSGTALTLQRSFAEHMPAPSNPESVAIIETGPLFALLYLNNNLHSVHHGEPAVPWYRLPALYRARREAWRARNGGVVYRGYMDLWRRFALRTRSPVHPATI